MKVLIIFGVLAVVAGESTQVSKCTRHSGDLPSNTYVEGCTTPPCSLQKGQDAVMNLTFKTPRPIKSMKTLATAYLMGIISVPYDLEEQAVTCNYLTNTYCPILQDEVVEYTLKMYINPVFPAVTVDIEFSIVDENDEPVTCFRMPISVVSSSSKLNDSDAQNEVL